MVKKLSGISIGDEPSRSTESDYVAQLGRISGKALQPNLVRNGTDLSIRNAPTDSDLLYIDVNNNRIGIKTESPIYDLEVVSDIKTTNLISTTAQTDNILISESKFSTVVGPINIVPSGIDPKITIERLITDDLEFNDNTITTFNNANIILEASGSGTLEFQTNATVRADLSVTGNITLDGNLSKQGDITIGDEPLDVIIINTDFTQSIIPGQSETYDLGSQSKNWNALYTPDLSNTGTVLPQAVDVSNQMKLDGVNNKISGLQSNEDINLLPATGIVFIEQTKWQDNDITNLLNTPLTFASTGIGYTRFVGDNAFEVPSGPTTDRRPFPEVGETRWNTDLQYLECFDGTVWLTSIGPGDLVAAEDMEEFGNLWSLILG